MTKLKKQYSGELNNHVRVKINASNKVGGLKITLPKKFAKKLEYDAVSFGADCIIAEISDENDKSISFHLKHGYKIVGELKDVAIKFNRRFGVIYVQKFLNWFKRCKYFP